MFSRLGSTGKATIFFLLFLVPLIATIMGGQRHLERSKRTEFCLSCHTMEEHGKSLLADDPSFLPASHFQNNRIPRETACYTCHTDYTIYGDFTSKWRGLRHLYAEYVSGPPQASALKLYRPYNNRECLHCHAGARSFEEKSAHNRDANMLAAIKTNEKSCLSSGCHDIAHDIDLLGEVKTWSPQR